MQRAAALRLPVAVHAEFDRPLPTPRGASSRDFCRSRPVASECEAIRSAVELAGETGCALHVVHVSSGAGIDLIVDARRRGVDVTAETCPHYLVLSADDMHRLGAVAKCAPPLRDDADRSALVEHVRASNVDTLGSDHSPSPWSMKQSSDFFEVWGGIAGVQHMLPLLLELDLDPATVAQMTADHVARRFRLPRKGRIAPGYDADLVLVQRQGPYEVTPDSLLYRHPISPYVGRRLRGRVRQTILCGQVIVDEGQVVSTPSGRLLLPS
jgi:allantoinase